MHSIHFNLNMIYRHFLDVNVFLFCFWIIKICWFLLNEIFKVNRLSLLVANNNNFNGMITMLPSTTCSYQQIDWHLQKHRRNNTLRLIKLFNYQFSTYLSSIGSELDLFCQFGSVCCAQLSITYQQHKWMNKRIFYSFMVTTSLSYRCYSCDLSNWPYWSY